MRTAEPAVSSSPRNRLLAAVAAAAAIGAVIVSTPGAAAADAFGPGYSVPVASHLGAYGAPGSPVPGVGGLSYCADPDRVGPSVSAGYGQARSYSSWSTASGIFVTRAGVADAAYVLGAFGATTDDAQAAAVDAAVTSLLNPGTTYALPGGARAEERVSAPNVPSAVRARALSYMSAAARYAGPYTIHITPQGQLHTGQATPLTITVTSAEGYRVPNVQLHVAGRSGPKTDSRTLTTGSGGTVTETVTPVGEHDVTLTATATLPGDTLRAVIPHNPPATS